MQQIRIFVINEHIHLYLHKTISLCMLSDQLKSCGCRRTCMDVMAVAMGSGRGGKAVAMTAAVSVAVELSSAVSVIFI